MFIYFAKHVLLRFFCFNLLVCHNKASVEDLDKIVDLTTIQMRSTVDKNNVRMWLDLIVLGYCRVFVGVFSSVVNLWSASWCGCLLSLFFLSFFLHFSFFLSFFLSFLCPSSLHRTLVLGKPQVWVCGLISYYLLPPDVAVICCLGLGSLGCA